MIAVTEVHHGSFRCRDCEARAAAEEAAAEKAHLVVALTDAALVGLAEAIAEVRSQIEPPR